MSLASYHYGSGDAAHTQSYLLPTVITLLERYLPNGGAIFELGSGNGANAVVLEQMGYIVTGVDPSWQGLIHAEKTGVTLFQGSTEDDLVLRFGRFPVVLSLEVAEHVYSPALYVQRIRDLLQPGGVAIVSTPYHSYLKNLALAVSGKLDAHFTALWEGGHIKFWSRKTLRQLFQQAGLIEVSFARAGRIAPLAKSMIVAYHRPA